MVRLHVLGPLAIANEHGPLSGAAAQPKRLKLLAVLDRAGERGMNREQLVDHLWSDGDSERGRGSLNTAVNALRQHLGADALLTAGEHVRLNTALVASDARDFEAALGERRLEDAVGLYGGPFLDGNDRRESQRFEEWVRVEREKLDAQYRRALEGLAEDAARRRDHAGAAAWWDRLVTLDPLDSRVVLEFVHALLRADDRARALRVAGIHEQLLRQHDIEPTPAWADAVARLRERRVIPPPIARSSEPDSSEPDSSGPGNSGPVSPEAGGRTDGRARELTHRHRISRRAAVVGAIVVLLLGIGLRLATTGPTPPPRDRTPVLDPHQVAVLYLEDRSPNAGLRHIAYGLTESLIDDLQRVPVLHVVAPDAVKSYRGSAAPLDSIARQLHVGTIIGGTVDTVADTLRVTVRLYDGGTARQLASHTVARPARNAAALERVIAADIAGVLRSRLGEAITLREQEDGTSNSEAWELVQRARRIQQDELSTDYAVDAADLAMAYERADSLLGMAEQLDRSWPVPPVQRAQLAEERAMRAWLSGGSWPPRNVVARGAAGPRRSPDGWRRVGLAHVERALQRDARNADALEYRGKLRFGLWRWGGATAPDSLLDHAITDLQAAADTRPYLASAQTALSSAHQKAGNFGLARLATERALANYLGPAAAALTSDLLFIALSEERYDDARRVCEDGQRRFPDAPELRDCEVAVLGWSGTRAVDAVRAWRVIDSVEVVEPANETRVYKAQRRMYVATILAQAGLADSAEAVIRQARAGGPAPWLDDDEAYVRLRLGQTPQALALLRRYLTANPAERHVVATSPWFKALHTDPEFDRLTAPRQ